MNVALIGMRAAGKSNVSRRLSRLTKWPVLSTDLLISYDNGGHSVAEIVARQQGDWHAFREMEYQVVAKAAVLDGIIIDCGGGMVVDLDPAGNEILSERKISALKQKGLVVWLKGDIPTLAARVRGDAERPALSDQLSAEEVMYRRLPFYENAADLTLEIDNKSRKEITQELLERLIRKGFQFEP
ncbi:MAG: shikimate kinase [Magnetococcales bacterium]|nr:shikimate kinase [Magnetococcales bacterium]